MNRLLRSSRAIVALLGLALLAGSTVAGWLLPAAAIHAGTWIVLALVGGTAVEDGLRQRASSPRLTDVQIAAIVTLAREGLAAYRAATEPAEDP